MSKISHRRATLVYEDSAGAAVSLYKVSGVRNGEELDLSTAYSQIATMVGITDAIGTQIIITPSTALGGTVLFDNSSTFSGRTIWLITVGVRA